MAFHEAEFGGLIYGSSWDTISRLWEATVWFWVSAHSHSHAQFLKSGNHLQIWSSPFASERGISQKFSLLANNIKPEKAATAEAMWSGFSMPSGKYSGIPLFRPL